MTHSYSLSKSHSQSDVYTVLKQYEGQSLTLIQLSQITGLSVNEVKKEVEELVYQGGEVCYYKGKVFIANSTKEFPIYLMLFVILGFVGMYTVIQTLITVNP